MLQTAIVVVEPQKANFVLAELGQAKAEIVSVSPIDIGAIDHRQDILVTFAVEHESEAAHCAFLCWMEDTLGPNCQIY
jgi:hypothetical protein